MYLNAFLNLRKSEGYRPIEKAVFVRSVHPFENYSIEVKFLEKKWEEKLAV